MKMYLEKKEVSKFFNDEEEARREFEVVERLRAGFSEAELDELRNYTILPKQLCRASRDMDVLRNYTVDWFKDAEGMIPHGAPHSIEELMGKTMVISEKGLHNLYNEIETIQTFDDVKKALHGMGNVLKGVQQLVNKQYCHFDMKLENCVAMEPDAPEERRSTDYRLIDMSEVFNFIEDGTLYNLILPCTQFMYIANCPDSIFTSYLIDIDDMNTEIFYSVKNIYGDHIPDKVAINLARLRFKNPWKTTFKEKGMNMDPRLVSLLYTIRQEFNTRMHRHLHIQFGSKLDFGYNNKFFSNEEYNLMKKMEADIRKYRFLHASHENYRNKHNFERLFTTYLNDWKYYKTSPEEYGLVDTVQFLKDMSDFYSQFDTKEQMASFLVPYLMMYSFSYMVFNIYIKLLNVKTVYQDEHADEFRRLTMSLLSFLHETMRGGMHFNKLDESSDVSAFNQMCEYYYSEFMDDSYSPRRASPVAEAGEAPLHSPAPQPVRRSERIRRMGTE